MSSTSRRSEFDRLPDYLKKPVSYLLTFVRTLIASLKADPELLVRNPRRLAPPLYAAACTTAIVIIFKTAWPDDPIKAFQYPKFFAAVAPILEIVPLPLFTFAAAWLLLTSLPMYAVTQLLGYKPRILRIYHATVYSQFTIVLVLGAATASRLVLAAPLSGHNKYPFDTLPVQAFGWANMALILYLIAVSLRLLAHAHGVKPWKFFLLNFLTVALPLTLLDNGFPNSAPTKLIMSVFHPQPVKMFSIPSQSMWPTLPAGSYVVANQLLESSEYRVGDVVTFDVQGTPWIKRIVARGGESVQLKAGRLFIDGALVERTLKQTRRDPKGDQQVPCYIEKNGSAKYEVCEISGDSSILDNTRVFQVPDGHFFLMGDNRDNSNDSRFGDPVGFVPMTKVYGKAYFAVFPRELGYLYKSPEPQPR